MKKFFEVGDMIFGYCQGMFGGDDYDMKICVLVTPFYAVFEYMERKKGATILNVSAFEDYNLDIVEWKTEVK